MSSPYFSFLRQRSPSTPPSSGKPNTQSTKSNFIHKPSTPSLSPSFRHPCRGSKNGTFVHDDFIRSLSTLEDKNKIRQIPTERAPMGRYVFTCRTTNSRQPVVSAPGRPSLVGKKGHGIYGKTFGPRKYGKLSPERKRKTHKDRETLTN